MPKAFSLKYKKDFDNLFTKGKRFRSTNFSLVYTESNSLKFAIIVRKKLIAKANSRNYIRRVVREVLRKEIIPKIPNPFHFALILNQQVLDSNKKINYLELEKELIKLFEKFTSSNMLNEKV